MSPKLIRLMFAATLVAGFSAPMLSADAAPRKSGVDAYNMPKGFFALGNEPTNLIEINVGDTVGWTIMEGEHTITPRDGKQWGDDGSGNVNAESPQYVADNFKSPGDYFYFCEIHGSREDIEKPGSMWGVIHVNGPTTTTTQPAPPTTQPTTPATQPPATTTTRPGVTPPATSATAPTTRPGPTAPATTATTAKPDKDKKKDGKEEETTTTSSTLPPPIDLPNEAIVPTLPGSGAAPGSDAEAPIDTPEGEAVALLKSKKNNGGDAVKLLIISGLGLGALGIGAGGYKYANRSSKYFPA